MFIKKMSHSPTPSKLTVAFDLLHGEVLSLAWRKRRWTLDKIEKNQ